MTQTIFDCFCEEKYQARILNIRKPLDCLGPGAILIFIVLPSGRQPARQPAKFGHFWMIEHTYTYIIHHLQWGSDVVIFTPSYLSAKYSTKILTKKRCRFPLELDTCIHNYLYIHIHTYTIIYIYFVYIYKEDALWRVTMLHQPQ
jgi:hypothetical protein